MLFPYNRSLPPEVLADLERRINDNRNRGMMVIPSDGMKVYDMQQPSVGRVVHYMARGSADGVFPPVCRAAVVTEVGNTDPVPEHGIPYVGVCVLNPTGLFFHPLVNGGGLKYDEGRAPGTWHWPEMVPATETIDIMGFGSAAPVRTETPAPKADVYCEQCGGQLLVCRDSPQSGWYYDHADPRNSDDHSPVY